MAIEKMGGSDYLYLSVIGGHLVSKSEEGAEDAKRRDYELKDGTKGTKWEIHYKNLSGFITAMEFKDGQFGEQFILTLEEDGESYKISVNTDSKYFSDFARKVPNIDLKQKIEYNPYDFESKGKKLRGVSIKQDGVKVLDYYFDYENKKALNKMPEVNKKDLEEDGKDYWVGYFLGVKKFLKKEIAKVKIPEGVDTGSKKEEASVDDANEIFDDGKPPF